MKIEIPIRYDTNAIWAKKLLYLFIQHPHISNIKITNFPKINLYRNKYITPFKINDKLFLIDDWDYGPPTNDILNRGIDSYYSDNNTIILKIQYDINDINIYDQIYNKYNIKVVPFIMFANSRFEYEYFIWKSESDFKFLCCITGKAWRNRRNWIRMAQEQYSDIIYVNNSYVAGEQLSTSLMKEWSELIKFCRWGLILKGKGLVGKNRREVEYSSCKIPMALNYTPKYHFDFEPNYHYIYLETPNDFKKLLDEDPQPYSDRAWEIYSKYYSPQQGIYNSFMYYYYNY